jgi:hypothetical protein
MIERWCLPMVDGQAQTIPAALVATLPVKPILHVAGLGLWWSLNRWGKTYTLTRERLAIHRQLHPKTTLPFKAEKNFRFSCLQQHGPSQEPFAPRLY